MASVFDMNGQPTTDPYELAARRSEIIASLLEAVCALPSGISYSRIFRILMEEHDLPEEVIGPDIMMSAFILLRSGLIISNTDDPHTEIFTVAQDTHLLPSPRINHFVRLQP